MPQDRPYKRPQGDTTRLKANIARRDSSVRALTRSMAHEPNAGVRDVLRRKASLEHKRANTEAQLLDQLRKAAPKPGAGHKSFAENTEGFDGATPTPESSPAPARMAIPRGHPARDALPTATGRPSAVQTADGTDNIRGDYRTLEGSNNRTTPSGVGARFKPSGVDSFSGGSV